MMAGLSVLCLALAVALMVAPKPALAAEESYPDLALADALARRTVVGGGGVPLLVAEAGAEDRPVLLLIHGIGQSHLSWLAQFASPRC